MTRNEVITTALTIQVEPNRRESSVMALSFEQHEACAQQKKVQVLGVGKIRHGDLPPEQP